MTTDRTEDTGDKTSQDTTGTSDKTYTEADVAEIRRKADSDALADAGRATKAAEQATKTANSALARLKEMESRAYEADRERYRDNPEQLSVLESSRRKSESDAKLEEAEQKLTEATVRAETAERSSLDSNRRMRATEVATRMKVDPALLSDLAMLTDGSVSEIEAKAKMLPNAGIPQELVVANQSKTAATGKGHKPSLEELRESDPMETQKKIESGEWDLSGKGRS